MRSAKSWKKKYHVRHLPSDFKKKNGYKRSTELSREYGLYRQDFCGCVFSKRGEKVLHGQTDNDKLLPISRIGICGLWHRKNSMKK